MTRGILAAVLALLLVGCAGDRQDRPIAVSDFRCDNGLALRVAWWADKAEADYGPQHWTLPIARSGSGARYSDGVREVWEHQGVVRVTDGAAPPMECHKAGS